MCCSAMPFHPAVLILICRKISATFPRMHQRIARHGATRMSARNFGSLQKFDYHDPFRFTDMLTDEERMVEETAKQYA